MGAGFTSARQNNLRPNGGGPNDQHRFAEDGDLCRRSGGAAEVHAQIAVTVVVIAVGKTVRRVHTERGNQRDRGYERDQVIAAMESAQRSQTGTTGRKAPG